MTRLILVSCLACFGLFVSQYSDAQVVEFSLSGSAGPGVNAANEPNDDVVNGGSGDVGPTGIFLNLSTGILSVDAEWGSANGFTDLSSNIDSMNIHGPTSNTAPNNFFDSAGVFEGLNGFDPSASSGGYVGQTSFADTGLKSLFEGRFYLHLHTMVNADGEARGYLIPEVVLGDINGDTFINLLDIAPFVDAVSSGLFIDEADMNRDGVVNLLDVDFLVTLLSSS